MESDRKIETMSDFFDNRAGIYDAHMIIELLKKIQKEYNTTFVFATHDEKIVSNVDRLINIVDGNIISDEKVTR